MVACKIGFKVKKQWTDKHVVNLPRQLDYSPGFVIYTVAIWANSFILF